MARVDEIIDSYGALRHQLIAIMQDIQAEYKYLSPEVLERIAQKLDIGVAKVYSVATFYENFSLEAKGKYIIKVCDGTACHVRKSQPIYNAIREYLGLEGKQKTSANGLFTLESWLFMGAMLPTLALGVALGSRFFRSLDEAKFKRLVLVLLLAVASAGLAKAIL
jgi:NADH-quinone oxidoreductase subunit E